MNNKLYIPTLLLILVSVASIAAPTAMAYIDCRSAESEIKPNDHASILKAKHICEAIRPLGNVATAVISTKK